MKVLQLGKFYPIGGGVEKVMYDLAEGLGAKGVQCDMLCASLSRKGIVRLNPFSRVVCRPAVAKIAATMISPSMVFYLRRHAAEYDIIHVHHPDPMAALALRLSGYKGRVILHWHSDIIKQKTILKFYKPLQNWLIRRSETIVGTTPKYVGESPHLSGFRDKVTYLPIGVDRILPDADRVKALRSRYAGKKIVFALGRFVGYKGFEYLVDAAAKLPGDYLVVIAGDGPLRGSLIGKAEGCGVVFPGLLSDEDRAAWFGAADVFVLCSIQKTEAFGIVQIEAMSAGCPVVATRIPQSGVDWVNEDGESGLNVAPESADALADAIVRITSSEDVRKTFSDAALKRYDQLFTRQKMIEGCLNIYCGR